MKRRIIILFIVIITGLLGFYLVNKRIKLINLSSVSVSTDEFLDKRKVKIQKGFCSIDRVNDAELFQPGKMRSVVYDGKSTGLLNTGYGENDFLITYDNKYYFQFRHFIFNDHDQHSYNFKLSKLQDTIYVQADIVGPDNMAFKEPMHLISDSKKLRCNGPIDPSKYMYNMKGLSKP
jgi:hypothetical protein